MANYTRKMRLVMGGAVFVVALTFLSTAGAQKASAPRPQDALAIGEEHVRELLLMMKTDQNGNVTKQEYMRFMEAEFERLDKKQEGSLNARALNQASISAARFAGK
jgi:CRISPR/Cas system-associated endonuclease Cas3-HD